MLNNLMVYPTVYVVDVFYPSHGKLRKLDVGRKKNTGLMTVQEHWVYMYT